nr:hypothetical protein B0A51_16343 [Rachicladosporium sp. CCFEE 5018]
MSYVNTIRYALQPIPHSSFLTSTTPVLILAADAVFTTPELPEAMLLDVGHIGPLLLCERISKQWRATISGSTALQVLLFFKQVPDSTEPQHGPHYDQYGRSLPAPYTREYTDLRRMNHLLLEPLVVDRVDRVGLAFDPFALPSTANALRMYVVSTPIVRLDCNRLYYTRERVPAWYDLKQEQAKRRYFRGDWSAGEFVRRNLVSPVPKAGS